MAQTSVAQFAGELKVSPSVLLEQLQAAGVPKGRSNAAKYLAAFIEDVKATGLVAKAIADNKVVGLSIAAAT